MDCCDREVTSFVATSGWIDAEVIRDLLMTQSLEPRFGGVEAGPHKIEWLSDNAKYYTDKETLRFAEALGLVPCTTPAYSPESNGMAEAFSKPLKETMFTFMIDPMPRHSLLNFLNGLRITMKIIPSRD